MNLQTSPLPPCANGEVGGKCETNKSSSLKLDLLCLKLQRSIFFFGKTPDSQVFPDDVFLSQVASVANT